MASSGTHADQAAHSAFRQRNDLLAILLRRSTLFIIVFVSVFLAALIALIVIPTRYVASGSIIVAEQDTGLPTAQPVAVDKIGDPADLESQILLIRAPRILRLAMEAPEVQAAVLQECKARNQIRFIGLMIRNAETTCETQAKDTDTLVDQIQQHYTVSAAGRSRVINIAYESPLPDIAQTMSNALTNAFLTDRRAATVRSREDAALWLKQELQRLETSLRQDEDQVQAFRRKNGLMRGSNAPISSERLSSISQSLTQAENAQAEAAARLSEIRKAQKTGLIDSPVVMASRTMDGLKQQLTTITSQLASLSVVLGPKHPSLLALQQERDVVRQRMDQEMQSILSSTQKAYDSAGVLVASLKKQTEALKADAGTAADDEASIAGLIRSVEIKRGQYSELYRKIDDLETQKRVLSSSTRLVSLAELPIVPFFPKRTPFLAGGFMLALLLAGGAALVLDRTDGSLRSGAALTEGTGERVVVEVPLVKSGPLRSIDRLIPAKSDMAPMGRLLRQAANDPQMQEALGGLYASMNIKSRNRRVRSVLVTSSLPREGRTFTTLVLAQAVAATGRRVLVIESDFHRPVMQSALDLEPSPGLFELLQNRLAPREATFKTALPNLFVIPAGRSIVNSADLLGTEHMVDLLHWAQRFDLILLDTPPHLLKMDACLLSGLVDTVLCCARWGRSDVADVATTVRDIHTSGGQVMGIAMTMVDVARMGFYEKRPDLASNLARAS